MHKAVLTILLVITATGCQRGSEAEQLRYLDFMPKSMLVVKETLVSRSKYPNIDAHCHWSADLDPQTMIDSMDALNVAVAINLSGGWGEQLDTMLAKFHAPYPDRFIILANIDWSRIDEPDFGQNMAAFLEEAHAKGVGGLKITKALGLWVRDETGDLVPVDDPRLDPIWAKCGELGIPVLIHTADPAAFFLPVDRFNERWEQLHRHPDWSFYGPKFPSREQLFAQFTRMLEKHPGTMFQAAHILNNSTDLGYMSELFDRYPNLYADFSGRVNDLGRQPNTARKFLIKYQDRMLFGTDRYPGRTKQPRNRIYYRFLETDDDYFKYYVFPRPVTGDWHISGIHLPDEVLEKLYYQNGARLYSKSIP